MATSAFYNISSGRPPFLWSTFTSICWEPHQNLATEPRSYDICNEYSSIDVQNYLISRNEVFDCRRLFSTRNLNQADCLALLRVTAAFGRDWLSYADNHALPFSNIVKMWWFGNLRSCPKLWKSYVGALEWSFHLWSGHFLKYVNTLILDTLSFFSWEWCKWHFYRDNLLLENSFLFRIVVIHYSAWLNLSSQHCALWMLRDYNFNLG